MVQIWEWDNIHYTWKTYNSYKKSANILYYYKNILYNIFVTYQANSYKLEFEVPRKISYTYHGIIKTQKK